MAGSPPPTSVGATRVAGDPRAASPGRRSCGRYRPAPPSLGSALSRRPSGASRPRAGNGRAQLCGPGRWQLRPRLEVKVSGTAQLPSPRAIVGGRRTRGRPPAAGAASCLGTKAAAPAPAPLTAAEARPQPTDFVVTHLPRPGGRRGIQ